MKKSIVFVVCALLLSTLSIAQDDINQAQSCKYCGMDREKFSHSRMYIDYNDGTAIATCSLHCAAIDLSLKIDKTPKSIQVADFNSRKLIDAENAFWVIGGSKPGVMTMNAKWAFDNKGDADAFVKENGGKPASFEEAIKAAYEDMYQDTKMIREKRKMMKMKGADHQHQH